MFSFTALNASGQGIGPARPGRSKSFRRVAGCAELRNKNSNTDLQQEKTGPSLLAYFGFQLYVALPPPPEIQTRLFQIATRPRPIHRETGVLVPEALSPIPGSRLFTTEDRRRVLELGAGWGEFCASWCQQHPEDEYVAFEIKGDRIRRLLGHLRRAEIPGVTIIPINFNWFLEAILPTRAFDLIIINFPDPWPKKKHWKHRLIDADFPERMLSLLRPGGRIYAATDHGPYARRILQSFRRHPGYRPVYDWPHYVRLRPDGFPGTRFESMHLAQGLRPYYQFWEARDGEQEHDTA